MDKTTYQDLKYIAEYLQITINRIWHETENSINNEYTIRNAILLGKLLNCIESVENILSEYHKEVHKRG